MFAECLRGEYGYDTYVPYSGTVFDLMSGSFIHEAEPVPVKKKVKRLSDIFARLVAAGQRLMAVIYKNEGGANKDLAKFADQINSLSDKWDR
jgi:metallo-beta-lactamase family protein